MNAEQLARALGFKRSGNQWVGCCVAHDDKNPSMIIFVGRNGLTQVRCLTGCSSFEIIERLCERGLWQGSIDRWDGNDHPWDEDEARRWGSTSRATPNRNQMRALQIREQAVDLDLLPKGYIKGRGLELPASIASEVVRYHPRCPKGSDFAPALIVLMRSIETFEPQAIQRLYLEEDPVTGIVRKTDAMMLGPASGAAMMLSSREETFGEELAYCARLYVCEGFETALALYLVGCRPIWALGSAGAIARFPVLEDVGSLVICADNDENEVGLKAAVECSDRWNDAVHRSAEIKMPPRVGDDWCDHLTGDRHG